ncbi:MAG: hypothetical protein WB992_00600 [Bryobacteraceae bacterium]
MQIGKILKALGTGLTVLSMCAALSPAQEPEKAPASTSGGTGTWTPLTNQPPGAPGIAGANLSLLLTDGRILVHEGNTPQWQIFSPDSTGSYIKGTWGLTSTLPVIGETTYAPLYYASAVLADGRVVIQGGEYNNGPEAFTKLGAFYRPFLNQWLPLTHNPTNGAGEGDAGSIILASTEKWMVQDPLSTDVAILDPNHQCLDDTTNYWTAFTPAGKADRNDEEPWVLLPDLTVLAIDAENGTNSERYLPNGGTSSGTWQTAGSTLSPLADPNSAEVGPAVLRPNGTVFATGACPTSGDTSKGLPCNNGTTGQTAVFTNTSGSNGGYWDQGPSFPGSGATGLDIADGPGAILPNGSVLVFASPGLYLPGGKFFKYTGSSLVPEPNTPNGPGDPSYVGSMLVLPTGQIWFADGSGDVEIYTPSTAEAAYQQAWQPTITAVETSAGVPTAALTVCTPQAMSVGTTYIVTGKRFNGMSQGAYYGDDEQMATNYPLVRITDSTGAVSYCRTHNHSYMGVQSSAAVSTQFDVGGSSPGNCQPAAGEASLVVVANGIPSAPMTILIASSGLTCPVISCNPCTCPDGGGKRTPAEDAALAAY